MQELKFVRTENGALVVTDEVGEFYSVAVDDAVVSGIRQLARGEHHSKASPKEIQSLIRSGKTLEQVAQLTGAELDDVERFGAPVIAEREFILESALRVTVVTDPADAHGHSTSFGAAIHDRLNALKSRDVAWTSWRDETDGWMVAVDFTSRDVDHNAQWLFDHKKGVLSPLNDDATTLSQQGAVGDRLIPKLRAVEVEPNDARFDSGAFKADISPDAVVITEVVEPIAPSPIDLPVTAFDDPHLQDDTRATIEELAVARDEEPVDFGQTADLLDALRRRRGERDSEPQPIVELTATEALPESNFSVPVETDRSEDAPALAATQPLSPLDNENEKVTGRRGRQEVPSWDDILFGTRSDEDPA